MSGNPEIIIKPSEREVARTQEKPFLQSDLTPLVTAIVTQCVDYLSNQGASRFRFKVASENATKALVDLGEKFRLINQLNNLVREKGNGQFFAAESMIHPLAAVVVDKITNSHGLSRKFNDILKESPEENSDSLNTISRVIASTLREALTTALTTGLPTTESAVVPSQVLEPETLTDFVGEDTSLGEKTDVLPPTLERQPRDVSETRRRLADQQVQQVVGLTEAEQVVIAELVELTTPAELAEAKPTPAKKEKSRPAPVAPAAVSAEKPAKTPSGRTIWQNQEKPRHSSEATADSPVKGVVIRETLSGGAQGETQVSNLVGEYEDPIYHRYKRAAETVFKLTPESLDPATQYAFDFMYAVNFKLNQLLLQLEEKIEAGRNLKVDLHLDLNLDLKSKMYAHLKDEIIAVQNVLFVVVSVVILGGGVGMSYIFDADLNILGRDENEVVGEGRDEEALERLLEKESENNVLKGLAAPMYHPEITSNLGTIVAMADAYGISLDELAQKVVDSIAAGSSMEEILQNGDLVAFAQEIQAHYAPQPVLEEQPTAELIRQAEADLAPMSEEYILTQLDVHYGTLLAFAQEYGVAVEDLQMKVIEAMLGGTTMDEILYNGDLISFAQAIVQGQ